jgi:hypothetical protein
VILRNMGLGELNHAIDKLIFEEYRANKSIKNESPKEDHPQFYYGNEHYKKLVFPFQFDQNWMGFIGAITSTSFLPDEDHSLFKKLEQDAGAIFSRFSDSGNLSGKIIIRGETELLIGQPSR